MGERTVISNIAGRTDMGMVRTNNEDNLIMADLKEGSSLPGFCQTKYAVADNALALVVSDGVGGGAAGEVASELTVLAIKDVLVRVSRDIPAHDRIVAAVEEANLIVWNHSNSNPEFKGMAATVTAALIEGDQAFIAEVGDSRAYLLRAGNIKQVTTDQSFVAQLISRGLLKPEDAVQHPRKNVILQAIGTREVVKVAVSMFQLHQGDALLMCTDGLSNLVNTAEMLFFAGSKPPAEACDHLIELAKQRGGSDNITCIIATFEGDGLNAKPPSNKLTGLLQTLSTYDPDQEVQKSHKRTQLLGNAGLADKLLGGGQAQAPKLQPSTSLASSPNCPTIKRECELLLEWVEYSHKLLTLKTKQVIEAADYLETQGEVYIKFDDTMDKIHTGLEYLDKVRDIALALMQEFVNAEKSEV